MVLTFVAIAITAVGSNYAKAQDFDAGKTEYQSSCATCHGGDGKGQGPISPLLKVAPPDLTVLAKKITACFPLVTFIK
jgi:mono/diheme cytochrome c family protein